MNSKNITILSVLTMNLIFVEALVKTDTFVKAVACLEPSVTSTASYVLPQNSTINRCASLCVESDVCKSYSVQEETNVCYLNDDLLDDTGCVDGSIHFNSKKALDEPRCLNDGVYNMAGDYCTCVNSYVGDRCERLMQDCSEGYNSGHYTGMKGMFDIHPLTSSTPLRVRCLMQFNGRTVILQHDSDSQYLNFTRNWNDYKNGFGNIEDDGNFYIGNEFIHLISSNREQGLLFDVIVDDPSVNNYRQIHFSNTRVANESQNYRLTYESKYSSELHLLGNCFPGNNIAFSTVDQDNDNNPDVNCALTHMSGWWFDDCGPCNPTGKLQNSSEYLHDGKTTSLSVAVPNNYAVRELKLYLVHSP